MAKYQNYAEYKDSGVEWLGEIPSHWATCSLSKLFSIKAGGDVDLRNFSEDQSDEYLYPIYTNANDAKSVYGYSKVANYQANSITVSGRGEVGFAVYRDHAFDAIIRLLVLSPLKECEPKFFAYFINEVINFRVESSAIGQLSTLQISPYKIVLPSLSEQKSVVDYLDHETAKIDSLIAKQEKLIELLKEKRQAVISHAVTKGLNPNVAMKDSGVEWLGQVPEHWLTPRLKQLIKYGSSISYGIVQPGDPLDEGVPFIQTTNISKGSFALEDFQKTSVSIESNYPRSRLEGGEVILGIRASIGAAFVVPMSFKGVNLSRGIARIVPNNLLRADFLVWYFKSNAVDQYWGLSKQGSTFSEVSIETVKELNVVIPPLVEQADIAKYLTNESNKFEKLINSAETQKILLQERRTALISSAVTGKIDVRNWQNSNKNNEANTELDA